MWAAMGDAVITKYLICLRLHTTATTATAAAAATTTTTSTSLCEEDRMWAAVGDAMITKYLVRLRLHTTAPYNHGIGNKWSKNFDKSCITSTVCPFENTVTTAAHIIQLASQLIQKLPLFYGDLGPT